jgi:hypothetical protein
MSQSQHKTGETGICPRIANQCTSKRPKRPTGPAYLPMHELHCRLQPFRDLLQDSQLPETDYSQCGSQHSHNQRRKSGLHATRMSACTACTTCTVRGSCRQQVNAGESNFKSVRIRIASDVAHRGGHAGVPGIRQKCDGSPWHATTGSGASLN